MEPSLSDKTSSGGERKNHAATIGGTTSRKYSNGEITVFWKPRQCMHSAKCFLSLSAVFDPTKDPWIEMSGAPTERIISTVTTCPSGALSYKKNTNVPGVK